MGIINRYIGKDFLVGFGMTVFTFTFVMGAATIVRGIDLMSRGVSGALIGKIFLYNLPYILAFSIPMSVMTSALLLFSRLSFDGEITAMRACGMSMWQIVSPVIIISVVLSCLCLYLNNTLAPNSRFARTLLLRTLGVEDPIGLLDEGRFVRDFPGLMIYVGKKRRNTVRDIVVYETGPEGVKQHVRASHGEVIPGDDKKSLTIDLYDVRIDRFDPEHPLDPSRTRSLTAEKYPVKLDFSELLDKGKARKRTKDLTFSESVKVIRSPKDNYPELKYEDLLKQRMKKLVEVNKRFALAISCFAFVLLAIPLGMKSRRKESSVGVGISLIVVFTFYSFIVFAESMSGSPSWRPDLIIWIPVVAAEVGGLLLLRRIN